jgi:hypothetical protein
MGPSKTVQDTPVAIGGYARRETYRAKSPSRGAVVFVRAGSKRARKSTNHPLERCWLNDRWSSR